MPVKIKSSGGGSVSLDVPSTGTDYTLTMPANNGTIFTSAGGTISGNVAFTSNNITIAGQTLSPFPGMRNRIINGNMTVFQRGTAATATETYSVDRWKLIKLNDASESVSQNGDNPGYGFAWSLRNTVSTADTSIGSTQYSGFGHVIEGYNIADLRWGTAYAKPATLSFWFRSPVTGSNFHATIQNADGTRICPVTFTVNSADAWEYKTITYPACTDGAWNITNGSGIILYIYMAVGSSYAGGTSGVWNSSGQYITSTQANLLGTNGNVIGLTGVQFEVGSIATPFEFRQYGTEFALCQRYYQKFRAANEGYLSGATNTTDGTTFSVVMRATPTISYTTRQGGNVNSGGNAYMAEVWGTSTYVGTNAGNYNWHIDGTANSEL